MLRKRLTITVLTLLIAQTAWAGGVRLSDFMDVLGSVTVATRPVDRALVVAFNLVNYDHSMTRTDHLGSFHIDSLPAGIYRIIAVAPGFAPAMATIVPNRRDHHVALRLEKDRQLTARERDEIWTIRRSLPKDVLREMDQVMGSSAPQLADESRFSGEMTSVTGMSRDQSGNGYTEAAVGLRGKLSSGWKVDLQGQIRMAGDQPLTPGSGVAGQPESSGLRMALQNSSNDSYEIATSRGRWAVDPTQDRSAQADVESHRVAWKSGEGTEVAVRYLSNQGVFTRGGYDSETLELDGQTTFTPLPNYDVGVHVRVGQVTPMTANEPVYRAVDLSTQAMQRLGRNVDLTYGIRSRQSGFGGAWAPETSTRIGLGSYGAFVVSGMYKVYGNDIAARQLPTIVFMDERGDYYPKYRYSLGWVAKGKDDSSLSLSTSVVEVDSPLRVVFADPFNDVWDGYDLDEGDVARDVTVSMKKVIADRLAIDLSTTAGKADNPRNSTSTEKTYVDGVFQSYYRPSGTSLDIAYRYVGQPGSSDVLSENERLLFRMGQSLRLPLDVRVLFGFDLARLVAPTTQADAGAVPAKIVQTRFVGGVSVGF